MKQLELEISNMEVKQWEEVDWEYLNHLDTLVSDKNLSDEIFLLSLESASFAKKIERLLKTKITGISLEAKLKYILEKEKAKVDTIR